MISFGVSEIFVSRLFLLPFFILDSHCLSGTYKDSAGFEEEHYDSSEKAKNQQQEVCTIMKEAKK